MSAPPARELELWAPPESMEARLAYVVRNFFSGLAAVRFREYRGAAAPSDTPDVPRLLLGDRGGLRAHSGALLAPIPRWTRTPRPRTELVASLRDVALRDWDREVPVDLIAALFDAYSMRGALPGGGYHRQPSDAPFATDGLATEPWIDLARRRVLGRLGLAGGPRAEAVVALTHDVDNVEPYAIGSIGYSLRQAPWTPHGAYRRYGPYLSGNLKHLARVALSLRRRETELSAWIEGERQRGIRSAYYFMEDRASRHDLRNGWYSYGDVVSGQGRRMRIDELMTALAQDGYEVGPHVGLHAYACRDAYAQSLAGVRARVGRVVSTRHHWCMIEPDVTLGLMEAEGIRFDLNFGGVGFDFGTGVPFHLYRHNEDRPSPVIAIPTVLMDDLLFKPVNLGLSVDEARQTAWDVLGRVEEMAGVVAISFHPSAYRGVDKRGFYFELLDACRARGIRLTTAAEAGAIASRRFPALVGEPSDRRARAAIDASSGPVPV